MKNNSLIRRFKFIFTKNFRKVTDQATEALSQEIDGIIDKTLSHQEMESLLIRAIEKLIMRMFRKYSFLIIGFIMTLFVTQLVILNFSIQSLNNCSQVYNRTQEIGETTDK